MFLMCCSPIMQAFALLQLLKYLHKYFLAKRAFILETLAFEGCSYSIVCSVEGGKKWEMLFKLVVTCGSSSTLMEKSLGLG